MPVRHLDTEPLLNTCQSDKMENHFDGLALYPQRGIHYVHSTGSQKATHFVYKPEGRGIQARHVQ